MNLLKFSRYGATTHKAIVVSFDLKGFSDFCNQPSTAAADAPRLIKEMFDVLNTRFSVPIIANRGRRMRLRLTEGHSTRYPAIRKRSLFSAPKAAVADKSEKLTPPDFNKFTGDGALMLWRRPVNSDFSPVFRDLVVGSMRDFQRQLSKELPIWERKWSVTNLPKAVRVGIATGLIYGLRRPHDAESPPEPHDFVGYCMNLAVRLQDHCPNLSFLVHGNLHPTTPGMARYEAIEIKGSRNEPVALFEEDIPHVPPAVFQSKFRPG